ncbi:MAG: hypothetical protein H6525_01200 [Actinobacteria bacterium]|nr:hypothetical protein [Actinomycetota bacterium]MCB9411460.1 hypothetical protein [Actinomycetota bacterium]
MITTITVSADIAENARQMAIGMAQAQGWTSIQASFVRQVGPREYEVQLTVSR